MSVPTYVIRCEARGTSETDHLREAFTGPNHLFVVPHTVKKFEAFFGFANVQQMGSILLTFPSEEIAQEYVDTMINGSGNEKQARRIEIGWPWYDKEYNPLHQEYTNIRIEKIGAINV